MTGRLQTGAEIRFLDICAENKVDPFSISEACMPAAAALFGILRKYGDNKKAAIATIVYVNSVDYPEIIMDCVNNLKEKAARVDELYLEMQQDRRLYMPKYWVPSAHSNSNDVAGRNVSSLLIGAYIGGIFADKPERAVFNLNKALTAMARDLAVNKAGFSKKPAFSPSEFGKMAPLRA